MLIVFAINNQLDVIKNIQDNSRKERSLEIQGTAMIEKLNITYDYRTFYIDLGIVAPSPTPSYQFTFLAR